MSTLRACACLRALPGSASLLASWPTRRLQPPVVVPVGAAVVVLALVCKKLAPFKQQPFYYLSTGSAHRLARLARCGEPISLRAGGRHNVNRVEA